MRDEMKAIADTVRIAQQNPIIAQTLEEESQESNLKKDFKEQADA